MLSTAAALTACSATPQPSPTPSAVACDPATAEITWQTAQAIGDELVGTYLLVYDTSGLTSTLIPADTEVTFDDDALRSVLGAQDDEALAAWREELIADFRRTGQVSDTWGDPVALPADSPSELADPEPGEFVNVVTRPALTVRFSVACAGGETAEGTMFGLAENEQSNTLLDCAAPPEDVTPAQSAALENCPA